MELLDHLKGEIKKKKQAQMAEKVLFHKDINVSIELNMCFRMVWFSALW